MNRNQIRKLIFSGLCMALGLLLPMLTMQLQPLGNMFLPMHFPVLLCGLVCGWQYGAVVGALTPLLRSLIFTMPPMYPKAIAMSFELCAYGLLAGLLYWLFLHFQKNKFVSLYAALIGAMCGGRLVWGAVQWVLVSLNANLPAFTQSVFWAEAVANAVPGIILQILLLPPLTLLLQFADIKRGEQND